MTIHQIECFLEVARTLNFTEAAGHLYISQQGLSRQISSLERELEMRLFERTTREVRLTRSGEILMWKWQNIPTLIRESVDMAREDNKREKDRIHVAILKMNGVMDVVGRILAEYSDQFPQTEFQLKEYSDVKDLAGINAPDLIITLSNGFDYTKIKDKFNWAELHSFPLYYVFSKKNPMAGLDRLSSAQLQQQTLLAVFRYEDENPGVSGKSGISSQKGAVFRQYGQPGAGPERQRGHPHRLPGILPRFRGPAGHVPDSHPGKSGRGQGDGAVAGGGRGKIKRSGFLSEFH